MESHSSIHLAFYISFHPFRCENEKESKSRSWFNSLMNKISVFPSPLLHQSMWNECDFFSHISHNLFLSPPLADVIEVSEAFHSNRKYMTHLRNQIYGEREGKRKKTWHPLLQVKSNQSWWAIFYPHSGQMIIFLFMFLLTATFYFHHSFHWFPLITLHNFEFLSTISVIIHSSRITWIH